MYDNTINPADLRQMISAAVREATQDRVSRNPTEGREAVLELDRAQFARAVYQSNDDEAHRIGLRLTGGGR